jgi:hypothetical protein
MDQVTETSTSDKDVYYKTLADARVQLLKEFKFKDLTAKEILSQLCQEPYNMIKNRDGDRQASTQWKITLETLWALNNAPVIKGRQEFNKTAKVKGVNFNRRSIYEERVFRADLMILLKNEIRKLGYERVYINVIEKYDHNEKYQTLIIKVPVN